jgi:hypothetical protein
VGYEPNHPQDAYRVLDVKNKAIMITRDVRWLGKTYGECFGVQGPKNLKNTDMEESDDENYITLRVEKIGEEVMETKKRSPEECN